MQDGLADRASQRVRNNRLFAFSAGGTAKSRRMQICQKNPLDFILGLFSYMEPLGIFMTLV